MKIDSDGSRGIAAIVLPDPVPLFCDVPFLP